MRNELFIFDTNTIVSVFLARNSVPAFAFDRARKEGHIVMCQEVYQEISNVLVRAKFDKYLSTTIRMSLLEDLKNEVIFVEPHDFITACRDPKDDIYLFLAVSANAMCIVTGDKDLLILNPFRTIPIINAATFLSSF